MDKASVAIVLLYASTIAYLVYSHAWEFKTSEQSLTWIQPQGSSKQPLIFPDHTNIEFDELEKSLKDIPFDSTGDVALNSITIDIIKKALKKFPKDASPDDLEKIRNLIKRMHPQNPSNQLADIVLKFREYELIVSKKAYRNRRPQGFEAATKTFKEDVKLKERVFGKELSDKLFADRHAMTHFVLERKRIINNQKLTTQEKEQLLLVLNDVL